MVEEGREAGGGDVGQPGTGEKRGQLRWKIRRVGPDEAEMRRQIVKYKTKEQEGKDLNAKKVWRQNCTN